MLLLTPEVVQTLEPFSANLPVEPPTTAEGLEQLRALAASDSMLGKVAALTRSVLDEQGFAQVRGLSVVTARRVFPALACLLGSPFFDPAEDSIIIGAHVKPNEGLMGNQLRQLPLHTDYSMLLDPPKLTMSLCLDPDPVPGWGAVHVADIEALCFGLETDSEIERFMSVSLPFAARNANAGVDLVDAPIILSDVEKGRFLVRYHRSRIRQGFRARGTKPTPEQAATMVAFERRAAEYVQALHPQAGDITAIDNHRTVHARSRCSVQVDADGFTRGRQMQFIFAY